MKSFLSLVNAVALTVLFYGFAEAKLPPELLNKITGAVSMNQSLIKDMVKVETIESSLASAPGQTETTTYTKGSKSKIETKIMVNSKVNTTTIISDGASQWLIVNNMKMKQGQIPDKARAVKQYNDELTKNSDKFNVVRSETLNGRNCYVVESIVARKDGKNEKFLMWLDKENALTYQVIAYDASGKEMMKVVTSDYRTVVNNLKAPFKTEIYTGDKLMSKTVVKSMKVNKGLNDILFDVSGYKEIGVVPAATQIKSGGLKNMMKKKLPF
jgi:outer membrane lipoprotein-sorting protein